ncbi:MAG: peptidylprolyl isomerase [Planctomycetes bacterium]|nr:peptidylprolyl isomerase [Planctomycetota bacterium]
MNSLAASWWERVKRALKPLTESLSRLSPPRPKPVKVPVRTEPARRAVKSSTWVPSALLVLFAASCGGPNDPTPSGSTDPGASDPEVTSISPSSGPADGGTLVTITGVGFDPAELTEVLFGSNNATGVQATSETTIVCNAPAGVGGESVDVVVVMTSGSLAAPTQFTYEASPNAELEITWRNTSGGISTGVLTVELFNETPITSQNFRDLAEQGLYDDTLFHRIRFRDKLEGGDFENGNGTGGRAASYQGIGDETDSSTWRIPDEASSSPNHQPGALAMHLPAGPDSAGSVFYIACPNSDLSNRDGVNTVFGQATGGTVDGVDVGFEALLESLHRVATGSGNVPTQPVRLVEVRLSGGPISPPNGGDDDPDDGGDGDDAGGGGEGAPTIDLIDPPFGPPDGEHQIAVVGSGFAADLNNPPSVTFGGTPAEGTIVLNDGTMFCNVPAGPPGTRVDLVVTTPLGTITLDEGFQYLVGPVVSLHISWTDNDGLEHGGQIASELFEDDAPIHVENFLQLTEDTYYDHVPFHRIIDGFMIQGGDFQNGDGSGGHAAQYYGFGDPDDQDTWTLPDEANNGLTHLPGILSMAKTSLPNSGGSQFFFVDRDSFPSHLNGVHTVFGRAAVGVKDAVVVTGLDMVDELSQVLTDGSDRPINPVTIESAIRIGGTALAVSADGGGGQLSERYDAKFGYQPWLASAVWNSVEGSESSTLSGRGGTRGVFLLEGSADGVLRVSVRSTQADPEPAALHAVGERTGKITLEVTEVHSDGLGVSLSAALERDERLMLFAPRTSSQWIKAWVEPTKGS